MLDYNKTRYVSYCILWALVIICYFMIISFSAASAKESAKASMKVVNAIEESAKAGTKVVRAIKDYEKAEDGNNVFIKKDVLHRFVRKLAHVFNYTLLGFSHAMLTYYACKGRKKTVTFFVAFWGLCCASSDEFFQLFIEGRVGRIADVFVDLIGTVLSLILFFVVAYKFLNWKKEMVL